ncbi:hypothetical protein J6Q66_09615, partial [bacterium]|nr:hypothetical protein [bacterium]
MNNKLDAKIYLWNSLCEKLCFEKLSLKSIKATDSNLEDLKTLTIIYSHSISKSFKILTIYSELAEKSQTGKDIGTLSNEICNIIVLSEFDDMLWQGNLQVLEKYKNY